MYVPAAFLENDLGLALQVPFCLPSGLLPPDLGNLRSTYDERDWDGMSVTERNAAIRAAQQRLDATAAEERQDRTIGTVSRGVNDALGAIRGLISDNQRHLQSQRQIANADAESARSAENERLRIETDGAIRRLQALAGGVTGGDAAALQQTISDLRAQGAALQASSSSDGWTTTEQLAVGALGLAALAFIFTRTSGPARNPPRRVLPRRRR